jgi:hypothetical protein|nr:MAG TPA: Cbb3-type cytochrome c oxidase subunit [Caudoviricetes sp.]
MYIDPFVAGVLVTVMVELMASIVYAIWVSKKK